jgi:hypothetical protein
MPNLVIVALNPGKDVSMFWQFFTLIPFFDLMPAIKKLIAIL